MLPEQFTPDRLDADDIWHLVDRTVHLDEKRDRADITERFATDLAVTTDDGTVHRSRVANRTAHPTIRSPTTTRRQVPRAGRPGHHRDRATAIERAVISLIASTTSGTSSTFSPRRSPAHWTERSLMPTTPARQRLRDLLDSRELIVAPGVFDGISAQLARRTGHVAAYLTGAGVAASGFGLPDIGLITQTEWPSAPG